MRLLSLIIDQPNPSSAPLPQIIHGAGGMPEITSTASDALTKIVGLGFQLLILAAIILSLLNIVWGGFNWLTSEGEKTRIGKARDRIVYSIIGLLVVFLAFFIINIIYYFFFKGRLNPFSYGG
jgi:TRAP-type C4-dicarboxylate transport system permease small subunit